MLLNFRQDLFSDQRTLMGGVQREWLQKQLGQSKATWNVLAQQVLMAKMLIPQELLLPLAKITNGDQQPETLAQMKQKITELVTLKLRLKANDPTLTAVDKARLYAVAPYNLDAWDGYAYEREVVYGHCSNLGKKQWCWQVILTMLGLQPCIHMKQIMRLGWNSRPARYHRPELSIT